PLRAGRDRGALPPARPQALDAKEPRALLPTAVGLHASAPSPGRVSDRGGDRRQARVRRAAPARQGAVARTGHLHGHVAVLEDSQGAPLLLHLDADVGLHGAARSAMAAVAGLPHVHGGTARAGIAAAAGRTYRFDRA